jgi:hypothetical protein
MEAECMYAAWKVGSTRMRGFLATRGEQSLITEHGFVYSFADHSSIEGHVDGIGGRAC